MRRLRRSDAAGAAVLARAAGDQVVRQLQELRAAFVAVAGIADAALVAVVEDDRADAELGRVHDAADVVAVAHRQRRQRDHEQVSHAAEGFVDACGRRRASRSRACSGGWSHRPVVLTCWAGRSSTRLADQLLRVELELAERDRLPFDGHVAEETPAAEALARQALLRRGGIRRRARAGCSSRRRGVRRGRGGPAGPARGRGSSRPGACRPPRDTPAPAPRSNRPGR